MIGGVLVAAGTSAATPVAVSEDVPLAGADCRLPNDQQLLLQVQGGDTNALANIYDRYSRLVYSVALRVLRDTGRAEDVLQEVFLKLLRRPESFCPTRGTLAPWLSVMARNRAIDVLRHRPIDEDIADFQLQGPMDVGAEVETSVLVGKVRELLTKVPSEQLEVLEMAFFQGLTHTEIAAATGLPLGTIKSRIRSALQILGRQLRQAQHAKG